jgi:very-short-patch-repair endonuclease
MSAIAGNGLDSVFSWPSGRVRTVFAESVPGVLADLKDWAADPDRALRIVTVGFDPLPSVKALMGCATARLAEIALALWPDWYGGAVPSPAGAPTAFEFEWLLGARLARGDRVRREVSIAWVKAAAPLCRSGRPPIPRGFSPAIHVAQLALAIDPGNLLIILCAEDAQPPPGRLLALARTAEWLAKETSARVLVVVPAALASSEELDSINFDAVAWPRRDPEPDRPRPEESTWRVWPVLGRPHPYSPGEQWLAERLAWDELLAGLFAFNVRVRTKFENTFLVDLFWAEGKIVVEVDGYQYHSNRHAFSADRRRDYELTVSGYLVLRLPHAEVVDDVERAVEKIRDMVRFRRSHPLVKGLLEP